MWQYGFIQAEQATSKSEVSGQQYLAIAPVRYSGLEYRKQRYSTLLAGKKDS